MPQDVSRTSIAAFMRFKYPELAQESDTNLFLFAAHKHPELIPPKPKTPPKAAEASRLAAFDEIGEVFKNAPKSFLQGGRDFLDPTPAAQLVNPKNLKDIAPLPPLGSMDMRPAGAFIKGQGRVMDEENAKSTAGWNKMMGAGPPMSQVGTGDWIADRIEGAGDYVGHMFGQTPILGSVVSQSYETAKTDPSRAAGQLVLGILMPMRALNKYNRTIPAGKNEVALRESGGLPRLQPPIEPNPTRLSPEKAHAERIQNLTDAMLEDIRSGTGVDDPQATGVLIEDSLQKHLESMGFKPPTLPTQLTAREMRQVYSGGVGEQVESLDRGLLRKQKSNMQAEAQIVVDVMAAAIKKSPDVAYKLLLDQRIGEDASRIAQVRKIVGEDVFRGMQSQIVNDLLRRSQQAEVLAADGSILKPQGQKNKLFTALTDGTNAVKYKNILGSDGYNKLKTIADVAATYNMDTQSLVSKIEGIVGRRLARYVGGRAGARAVGALTGGITGGGTSGAVGTILGGAAGAVTGEFTYAVVARLMTSREGANVLENYIRAVGNYDMKKIIFWSNRISNVVDRFLNEPTPAPAAGQPLPPPPG